MKTAFLTPLSWGILFLITKHPPCPFIQATAAVCQLSWSNVPLSSELCHPVWGSTPPASGKTAVPAPHGAHPRAGRSAVMVTLPFPQLRNWDHHGPLVVSHEQTEGQVRDLLVTAQMMGQSGMSPIGPFAEERLGGWNWVSLCFFSQSLDHQDRYLQKASDACGWSLAAQGRAHQPKAKVGSRRADPNTV